LGVTDKSPHQIAGIEVFPDVGRTQAQLLDRLHLRIDVEVIVHPASRPDCSCAYFLQTHRIVFFRVIRVIRGLIF